MFLLDEPKFGIHDFLTQGSRGPLSMSRRTCQFIASEATIFEEPKGETARFVVEDIDMAPGFVAIDADVAPELVMTPKGEIARFVAKDADMAPDLLRLMLMCLGTKG